MRKSLKIAHVASEIEPFSKSGGLANVIGALPRAHYKLGHKVVVITPFYEKIIGPGNSPFELLAENADIELTAGVHEKVSFYRLAQEDSPTVYFIGHKAFFGESDRLYGAHNENARFLLFDVAALALLKFIDFEPDIIDCHDWHTGLIPYFIRGRYKRDPFWAHTATLFTIHNLNYQLGHDWWTIPPELRDNGRSALPAAPDHDALERVNFAKRALLNADAINAVSETYREEIMTRDFGQELHRILKNRQKIVFGIVNGIDYNDYNPMTDPGLHGNYNVKSLAERKPNKAWLQKEYGLEVGEHIPLICMTSRIVEQKGFRLVMHIVDTIMRLGAQVLIMGDGDEAMTAFFKKIERQFPTQFVIAPFNHDRETSLYAGADIFLLPSRFEPCGINQLIAMRYGCVPVVHHIGGLADTVVDFNPEDMSGNGFVFDRYTARHLLIALVRALETYKHEGVWKKLILHDLKEANSWNLPAQKYIDLYRKMLRLKKK